MKSAFVLACSFSFALLPALRAAEPSLLAKRVQKAAEALPKGGIILAEQADGGTPVFSVAGQQEPAGVPPEKVIFEIGSISKVFTGILLAQAVIEKKVTLDTTVRELMGSGQAFADATVGAITLKQLATHTSGLPRIPEDLFAEGDSADPYAHYDRTHLAAYLSEARLTGKAPFKSSYSNLGVGLLGDLLATLYGKSWEQLVIERIAKPLGMVDTCVVLNEEQKKRFAPGYEGGDLRKPWHMNALDGAGALRSTAGDMLKFAQALEKPASSPLKAAIELTEKPHEGESIGLCLQISKINNRNAYWYAGGTGGFRTWISVRPTPSYLVVMLINNADSSPEEIISGKMTKSEPSKVSQKPADPALAVYAGIYDTGIKVGKTAIHYTFEVRGSDLWMQITGQSFIPLSRHPTEKDRFQFKPVNADIQFTREKDEVVSTTLFQAGAEIHAQRLSGSGLTKP